VLYHFHTPPTHNLHSLSLHDALPILPVLRSLLRPARLGKKQRIFLRYHPADGPLLIHQKQLDRRGSEIHSYVQHTVPPFSFFSRSEEHTSELQSRFDLVCRLLLEKKK